MTSIQPLFSLKDRVAVVTGSSKGIGEAIARGLAEYGAKVVVSSRHQEAVEEVAERYRQAGYEATAIGCHVGDAEQREHLIARTVETYGRLDVLVNNAAVNPYYGPLHEATSDAFDKIMDVNLKAPWALANAAFLHMRTNGYGSVINIASVEGIRPDDGLGLYSVSKAALIMLAKNQAKEWAPHGVRSNVICPGLIKTKFSKALWSDEKFMKYLHRKVPTGRMGTPEEMAGLAILLATPAGAYMTGGVYSADGGYLVGG